MLTVDLAGVERLSVWCGSCGQLERCSSECQSVAQTGEGERSARLVLHDMFGSGSLALAW